MNIVLFADQILSERERKTLSILEAIRRDGPLSRVEIAKLTDQNLVTTSKYVADLVSKGYVLEKGLDVSSGGRRPALVELNASAGYAIGLAVMQTGTLGVMIDLKANVVTKLKKPPIKVEREDDLQLLYGIVAELMEQSRVDSQVVKGVGLGLPGILAQGRRLIYKNLLEQKLGIESFIGSNVAYATFAEKWLSLDTRLKDLLYLYGVGTCGLVINGRVYRGINYNAGVIDRVEQVDGKVVRTCVVQGEDVEKLSQAAAEGREIDPQTAVAVGEKLGAKLAELVNLLTPEMIVVGGGMERAGSALIDAATRVIKQRTFEETSSGLEVIPARLGEDAVALGAAGSVVQHLFISS
ncbi:MAG: ROK family transcriptional regulator [Candidatus Omnitrophica bacterium]|nr:ROK family transcriptional regulator [Candidatus Omnitrophota bacterium]